MRNFLKKNSWFNIRFSVICLAAFDFLTLNCLFFYHSIRDDLMSNLISFSFTFICIVFFYIFGRYTENFSKDIIQIIKDIKVFIKSIALSLLVVYLFSIFKIFDVWIIFKNFYFIKFSIIFFFISLISNFFIKNLSENYKLKDEYWIAILNPKEFDNLKLSIKFTSERFQIRFDSINYLGLANKNKISGVIYDENLIKNPEFEELLNICIKNKVKFLTFDQWNKEIINFFSKEYIDTKITDNYFKIYKNNFSFKIKRSGDILFSLLLILITTPLFLLSAIMIFLSDKKAIFYTQKRNGLNIHPFNIIKFRSMKIDAEAEGIRWSQVNDNRVTKVGKILRKYRIDELPQLISVLKGEMSLIGPRPERPEIDNQLRNIIPKNDLRYKIKPGLTGWAQVNYPYGASTKDAQIKLGFDLYYIKNFSILLDFFILLKTIKIVFMGSNSLPK